MQDLNDKITGGTLSAAEWNQLPSEVQNVIEALGLVLSDADLNQLGKGVVGYAGAGTYFSESGVADAYVANPIGGKQGPWALDADHDGFLVRIRPGNANTGASTLNVNALGVKDIVRESGGALGAGDMVTTRDAYLRYDQASDDFILQEFVVPGSVSVARGYIDGVITSPAADTANDITWETGICRDSVDSDTIQVSSAITKQIDVDWVAGTNQGGFPSLLTRSTDTWYHLFVLKNPSTGAIDAGFDTLVAATNLLSDATGFTLFRRVGAVRTNATGLGEIIQYVQRGDYFAWDDASLITTTAVNPGTGDTSHALDGVPVGVSVLADVVAAFFTGDGTETLARVGPGDQTLSAATTSAWDLRIGNNTPRNSVAKQIPTNIAQAIKTRQNASNANSEILFMVHGWLDPRGQDA